MNKNSLLIWITRIWTVSMLISMMQISVAHANDKTNDQGELSEKSSVNLQEVNELIKRWLSSEQVDQFELKAMDASEYDQETFKISSSTDDRIVIEATSTSALLMGWNWYMKYEANSNISFNGTNIDLTKKLPVPDQEIERHASVEHRFALNDTDEGYTDPYADWEEWQRKIDILAILGINEVLVYPGQEAVYQKTFEDFGYTAEEMLNWIPGPAHQPWWIMQNLSTFPGRIPQESIDKRVDLGQKISNRLRELGMTPVFPGYYGMVPFNLEDKYPEANIVNQGTYHNLRQPDWLDTTTDLYADIAATYYEHQSNLFGDTNMFKMDLFHEGGKNGNVDIGEASKAVQEALNTAHPEGIWVHLGWHSNPLEETIAVLDKEKTLILDGISDRSTAKNREEDWEQTPYAFGTIWNFGGHTNMAANVSVWNEKFFEWRDKPGSALSGTALLPEAINNNPFAVEFFTELAWHEESIDMDKWVEDYVKGRYGYSDSHAIEAWKAISNTLYNLPPNNSSEFATELYSLTPNLNALKESTYFQENLHYDKAEFEQALSGLLDIDPKLQDSDAYKYDLMDVTRQVLANRGRTLLPKVKDAYEEGDKESYKQLSNQFLHYIDLTEEVTATNIDSLLGPWLEKAKNWVSDEEGSKQLEYDAKSLITIWTPRNSLNDYARRQWSGLVGDYYHSRWQTYFNVVDAALETGTEPETINWYEFGEQWVDKSQDYPTDPKGDIVEIANNIYDELAEQVIGTLDVTSDKRILNTDNKKITVEATFANQNGLTKVKNVELTLDVPEGFTVKPLMDNAIKEVNVDDNFSVKWEVTAPDNISEEATEAFTVNAKYGMDDKSTKISEDLLLIVEKEVQPPFKTVSFNDSTFSQSEAGDKFAIYGSGEDYWKTFDEYGTIYMEDAFKTVDTAVVRVDHQDDTSNNARAGIVVRNDLTKEDSSNGYLNMAITPGNGLIMSWDSNGDGQLDKNKIVGSESAPAYLKLSRNGSTFTGYGSKDGRIWTEVATVEIPSADSTLDIGLFMSAVNRYSGIKGLVSFSEFKMGSETNVFSLNVPHKKLPKEVPVNIDATFENVLDQTIGNMSAALDIPDTWDVKEITSTQKSEILPGEKVEVTWQVVVPEDAEFNRYNIKASANFEVDGETKLSKDIISIELLSVKNNLTEAFNNIGITNEDNPHPGNLDAKMSFSAQLLAEKGFIHGANVTHDGMVFGWPDVLVGEPDNVVGQAAIRAEINADKLSFIGTGVGTATSAQGGTGSIVYSDGSIQQYTIQLGNYYANQTPWENSVVAVNGRNTPSGLANLNIKYQLLYDSIELNPEKTVAVIILPDTPTLHIFSMTTKKEDELKDEEAAKRVDELIANLPKASDLTLEDKADIEEVRAAYVDLSKEAQGLVTKIAELEAREARIVELEKEEAERVENEKAAKHVDELIANLTQVSDLTLEDKDSIEEVRAAYDDLSEEVQVLVTRIAELEAREARIVELEKEEAERVENEKAAKHVDELIANLTQVSDLTLEDKASIEEVRATYDDLSEEVQVLVTRIAELEAREARIVELEDEDAGEMKDEEAAKHVDGLIDNLPKASDLTLKDKVSIEEVRAAYDNLSEEAQELVTRIAELEAREARIVELENEDAGELKDEEAAKHVDGLIDNLTKVTHLTLEDKAAIEEVRAAYDDLSEEAQVLVTSIAELEAREARIVELENEEAERVENEKAAKHVDGLISNLPKASELTLKDKASIEEVRAAYDALSEEAQGLVTRIAELEAREARIVELENEEAAKHVDELIYNLPKASDLTLKNKVSIEEVRATYDALSEKAQGLVSSIAELEAREARIVELENEEAERVENEKAAKHVDGLISNLPKASDLTLKDKASIEEVRAAYDDLSEEAQGLVTRIAQLEAREARIVELENEVASQDEIDEELNELEEGKNNQTIETGGSKPGNANGSNDNELPKTATSIYNWLMLGVLVLGIGLIAMFTAQRRKRSN